MVRRVSSYDEPFYVIAEVYRQDRFEDGQNHSTKTRTNRENRGDRKWIIQKQ